MKANEKTSATIKRRCIMRERICKGDRRATSEGDGCVMCVPKRVKEWGISQNAIYSKIG